MAYFHMLYLLLILFLSLLMLVNADFGELIRVLQSFWRISKGAAATAIPRTNALSLFYLTEIDGYLAPHINRHAIPLIRFELPLPQRVERHLAYQRMAFNNARLRQIAVFGQNDLDLDRTRDALGFGFGRQRERDLLFDVAHKLFLVDEEDAVIIGFIRSRRTLRRALATFESRLFGCRRRVAMR